MRNLGLALLVTLGVALGIVAVSRSQRISVAQAGDGADIGTATTTSASVGEWIESWEDALALATKQKKVVVADFTGTDWCVSCKRLEKDVFEKQEWKDWAAKNAVLLEVDFPRNKKQSAALKAQNQKLLDDNGVEGFPTIVVFDAAGKTLGKFEYEEGGPKIYIAKVEAIRALKK